MFCASFPLPGFVAHFAQRLQGDPNSENRGGVEIAGNICNYVICNKVW